MCLKRSCSSIDPDGGAVAAASSIRRQALLHLPGGNFMTRMRSPKGQMPFEEAWKIALSSSASWL